MADSPKMFPMFPIEDAGDTKCDAFRAFPPPLHWLDAPEKRDHARTLREIRI